MVSMAPFTAYRDFANQQNNGYGGTGYSNAPSANDPEALLAYMTRQDAINYDRDYGQFERDLVQRARTDTSLIDQARVDSEGASELMKGVASRNESRYGASLTPAQRQQQAASMQRGSALGTTQAVNNARLAQKDLNTSLLGGIVDVGQGVYNRSMTEVANAAQNKANLDNAYNAARAQSKAATYSTIGTIGAAAILAFMF